MSQTTPCPTCGAPQAPDQRYCLSCGARVAAPRLDFVAEAERAEAAATATSASAGAPVAGAAPVSPSASATVPVALVAAPAAPAPTLSRLDRIGGPMGAAAIVLVALGVGFLAGQATNAAPPEQKAPVVNIEGALPNGGAETPASDLPAAEETTGEAATDDPGASGDAGTTGEVPTTDDAGTTDDGADRSAAAPDDAATPPADEQSTADGGSETEAIG